MNMKALESNLFFCGLAASAFIHGTLIAGLSLPGFRVPVVVKPARTIEVTYEAVRKEPVKGAARAKEVEVIKSDQVPSSPPVDIKVLSRDSGAFPSFQESIQEVSRSVQDLAFNSKKAPPMKVFEHERTISIPMLQSEKITDPRYLSYTQNIRQRIKQRAYFYADNPGFGSGEVYLTFVLSSAGLLEGVQIIKEKTAANAYVQQVGVRSIQESAPFPPFPSDLNFPELTFNVIISFEVSE
ncbi:MAG: TonB C-terminal domain-containing protein [Candidatus Omnitrophica bacterium]|nr:TonB C-terminal domain-containing protein [Candidatus Omnitrophota bacterium]